MKGEYVTYTNNHVIHYRIIPLCCYLVFLGPSTACLSRRCLANELINKNLYSAPQSPGCVINVNLTSIQYKTLSVNTKTMQFSSRIKITMEWTDPDLKWSESNYTFNEIMLPVKKIWTPDLIVENAIYLKIKPANDIVVKSDGTVNYVIVMYTTVLCRINLLTYPFVDGSCPVAINGWNQSSCGLQIQYGSVSVQGDGGTEWSTVSVTLKNDAKTKNHNYIDVTISSNPFKALVSLVLPSALIMIADLVSFALPLDGGKRSSFKITLVLSFTMFLLILTDYLPNTGTCSPLIRYHFCFCMFVLVMSILISMVFTKVATEGNILCSKLPKLSKPGSGLSFSFMEPKSVASLYVDQTGTQFLDMIADGQSLRKIVNFVEKMDKKESEIKKKQMLAAKLDKICFWAYDTKALRFSSRIRIDMEWNDPDLAWTDTAYNFSEIMLPVDTIWTPDLTVDNSVKTDVKPVSTDLLVKRDGTVQHAIQMYTTVVCGINLFNYPFVEDACPVALNGWKENSYHFCFCLIILGLSLLASMLFSRFAESGAILPCWCSKKQELCNISGKDEIKKDINLKGVSTISDDVTAKDASIQKIVNFVANMERTNKEAKKRHEYASWFDRACFWGYLWLDILYGICIIAITRTEFCKINNLDFWI
ncbi:hypothetical protein QTP70_024182 [Hemibagrus guttatus]|uniref:5-hydroxytryptamine receptor 3A-like n=1 Tax=Hemibagrus guttatus TaxID=175788 RepID=A0AAE0QGS2_9TELE|nr:hypothetical protein QTP70_024182 [Hemibagrus guttatus]